MAQADILQIKEIVDFIKNIDIETVSNSDAVQGLDDFADKVFAIIDYKGEFIATSRKWMQLFGYQSDEISEQSVLSIIDKSDYNKIQNILKEINLYDNTVEVVNLTFLSVNDNKIDCCAGFYPAVTADGAKVVVKFIHEYNSNFNQDKLTNQQSKFILSIMNNIPNPVYYKNLKGIYLGCNRKFEEYLGKPLEEIFGKSADEVFSKEFSEEDERKDNEVINNLNSLTYETEIEADSGEKRNILISKSVFYDDNDKPGGIIGSFSDITQRILTEKNLKESEEKIRETNATKDKFLTIVSHDLKNPFTTLLGFSEMLLKEYDSFDEDEKITFITEINNSAKHAYKLLENLLQWSRAHTGRIQNEPQALVVQDIIWEVASALKDDFAHKKIRFFVDAESHIKVFADKNMTISVIGNLLSNSIKFSQERAKVSITATEKDDGNVYISVIDEGIGISEEDQNKLFRIDVHYVSIGPAKEKGTGLGLILCKEFLKRIGGDISVKSEFGKGSEFTISLPRYNS